MPTTPSNDSCEDAAELEIVPFDSPISKIAYGNTDLATIKANADSCIDDIDGDVTTSDQTPGVWFYVIGTGGVLVASTCHEYTNFDTILSIYKHNSNTGGDGGNNSCDNTSVLQCVVANDDGCSKFQSKVSWNSVVDEKYHILLHGHEFNPTGNYAIQLRSM